MTQQKTLPRRALIGVLAAALVATGFLAAPRAHAAVPGITGDTSTSGHPVFSLVASADYNSQPDGASIYSWGYGCNGATGFAPAGLAGISSCGAMQMPGPTLIVTEGDTVTVNLTNSLPPAAGNTSIVFAGYQTTATGGAGGLLTQEANNATCDPVTNAGCNVVSYSFVASKPGTYAYYSGTQPNLQIEMGMYGALIVKPSSPQASCASNNSANKLADSAYDNPATCYDREFLFQFSEMNSRVHDEALAQVQACATAPCPPIVVHAEPYKPNYYLVNGRSMPDNMDTPYSASYPHQPYNGNPQMHPGENMLMRIIGQGRWQHPFHFHGNHARVIARDGNLLVNASGHVAGPLLFTTPTVSGQSQDQIFNWTGKGLNWDVYNHVAGDLTTPCTPDANGYHSVKTDPNYGEWCADHGKPIPVTPPDPNIVANGQWYGGTPYLGLSGFDPTNLPPGTLNQNPGAGYAYMWHSHNEREITTNDVFPGGMMMMLIINAPQWFIDETL